jgi:hypothetical protein
VKVFVIVFALIARIPIAAHIRAAFIVGISVLDEFASRPKAAGIRDVVIGRPPVAQFDAIRWFGMMLVVSSHFQIP